MENELYGQGVIDEINRELREKKSTFDWIEERSFEWDHAWHGLWQATRKVVRNSEGVLVRDTIQECPESGEVWQYMGTSKGMKLKDMGNKPFSVMHLWMNLVTSGKLDEWWHHTFRHRNHPDTNDRIYLKIPASTLFVSNKKEGIPLKEVTPLEKNTIPAIPPPMEDCGNDYTPF